MHFSQNEAKLARMAAFVSAYTWHVYFSVTELIHRQTDLIILPDDVLTTVEAATAFNSASPPLASYVYEQQRKADDSPYGSCASTLDLQSFSFLEQGVTCNRSGVTISTVDALVAVIQTLDWEELIVLYSQKQGKQGTDQSIMLSEVECLREDRSMQIESG